MILGFRITFNARILNDGYATHITGEGLEEVAEIFESEVPHLCNWLERARNLKTGQFVNGYRKIKLDNYVD